MLDTAGTELRGRPGCRWHGDQQPSHGGDAVDAGLARARARATTSTIPRTRMRPRRRLTCGGRRASTFLRAQRGEGSGLTPAATAAHLRDHGSGPVGSTGQPRTGAATPAARWSPAGDRSGPGIAPARWITGASVCMHVAAAERHRGLVHRGAAGRPGRGRAAPCLCRPGQPLRQHLRAGLPAHGGRTAAFRAVRALERADVAGRRRPAPTGGCRSPGHRARSGSVLDPVEDELWAEADEVVDRPRTGRRWGHRGVERALRATAGRRIVIARRPDAAPTV